MTKEAAPAERFTNAPVRTESQLLILSTCKLCGESKIVPVHGGSLGIWQARHECKKRFKDRDRALTAFERVA